MRSAFDFALRRSPAQVYSRIRSARRLAVLAYHGINDRTAFARQLDYLCRHATPVGLEDVRTALLGVSELPARAVLITFDDGYRSVLENAVPELHRRGITAVAFVVPGLIGTDTPFWWLEVETLVGAGVTVQGTPPELDRNPKRWVSWLKNVDDETRRSLVNRLKKNSGWRPTMAQLTADDLRELATSGIAIGNHTLTHPCLDLCDDATVHSEIADAHAALTSYIGTPPISFAYPNGNFDVRAERLLLELGYELAFLFDHRLSGSPPANPLRISRLRVSDTTSGDRFATILSGLHPAIHHARGGR